MLKVVPISSAVFGLPGKRERVVGIDANHSDMCRFDPSQARGKSNLEMVMGSVEDKYAMAVKKSECLLLPLLPQDSLEMRLAALRGHEEKRSLPV